MSQTEVPKLSANDSATAFDAPFLTEVKMAVTKYMLYILRSNLFFQDVRRQLSSVEFVIDSE
jgi:hypothetical protein